MLYGELLDGARYIFALWSSAWSLDGVVVNNPIPSQLVLCSNLNRYTFYLLRNFP